MNTAQILVNAKKAVKRSWTKGSMLFDGAVCAAGGIGVAVFGRKEFEKIGTPVPQKDVLGPPNPVYDGLAKGDLLASGRAMKYLAFAVNPKAAKNGDSWDEAYANTGVVTKWNDEDTRSLPEVLAAFDKAIKNAKRRHVRGR